MSLSTATLIPGLILLLAGLPLLLGSASAIAAYRAFPRSRGASFLLFGAGAVWFLYQIWNLSPADFGDYHVALTVGFGAVAILAFKCVPDFLAVRGLAVLILLGCWPLLMAGYLRFDHPQIYFQKVLLYVALSLAIWVGAQPWRLRDFLEWLFARRERTRAIAGVVVGYGALLAVLAFTY
ncbi:MAG TPA: hypothetical protein VFE31_16210 [Opitutaceae bacterium]|jgi:hypothetical protein|nr:hypothetical protein [Opitutaceae bacterium]